MSLEFFKEAYSLDVDGLTNEQVRKIFREVCYVPAFEVRRPDISFRDHRMLKHFGHALELAYYSQENWAIHWASALMLIAKYRLIPSPAPLAALPGAASPPTKTTGTKGLTQ